jgi:2-dehydropantoate 2-reductase
MEGSGDMRILVVGAGAVGGYFGGRLLEARRDVTFLVRSRRAAELSVAGLQIRSRQGDAKLTLPPTILAEDLNEPFDLVILSCKSFDLNSAIAAFAPAVGPATVILPLLNGMRHLDILASRFGPAVIGGRCLISVTLNEQREIVHLSDIHTLSFGELDGPLSPRIKAIEKQFAGARFDAQNSTQIALEMWEKWVFIATLAGSTCLMRAAIGDIVAAPGGRDFVLRLLDECQSIAAAEGFPPRAAALDRSREMLAARDSPLTASMLRDMETGGPIEADHIVGDLLERASRSRRARNEVVLLPIVYAGLKTYEARRNRSHSFSTGRSS